MDQLTADVAVAVLGAGARGAGLAEVAARAGRPVRLLDVDPGATARAVEVIGRHLAQDVAAGGLEAAEARAIAELIHPVTDVAELAGCGVVVEAVTEDLAVIRDLLRTVQDVVGQGVGREALLATTASTLSVTAMATALRRPGLLVGLHLVDPAPGAALVSTLVEVVGGDATEPKMIDAAVDLVRSWGRTPVLCRCSPGFVVHRIARPFVGEAQRLVEIGAADPATIDTVLREAGGFRHGPFELSDAVGQDADLAVSRAIWERTFHDARYAPTVYQQRLVEAGRLGRATGRGVYAYTPEGERLDDAPLTASPHAAPTVVQLVDDDFGPMAAFLQRVEAGGVEIVRSGLDEETLGEELPGLRLPSGGLLRVTDGSTARSWTMEETGGVVLLDWAHDPATCERVALMAPRDVDPDVLGEAIGLCQAAGVEVSVIGDVAGGIVARTVAMLVNEAVDLVARREATATDVDVAMILGAAYPSGPLEWGDRLGAVRVASVLGELHDDTPTGRYRVAPRLDEAVMAEENLRDL